MILPVKEPVVNVPVSAVLVLKAVVGSALVDKSQQKPRVVGEAPPIDTIVPLPSAV